MERAAEKAVWFLLGESSGMVLFLVLDYLLHYTGKGFLWDLFYFVLDLLLDVHFIFS